MLTTLENTNKNLEEALQRVREICFARFSYNMRLLSFFTYGAEDEVKRFYQGIFIQGGEFLPWRFGDMDFSILRKEVIQGIQNDANFYKDGMQKISMGMHNQELIDELHFLFYKEYAFHKTADEANQDLADQSQLESPFILDILAVLKPFISDAEKNFIETHTYVVNITDDEKMQLLSNDDQTDVKMIKEAFDLFQLLQQQVSLEDVLSLKSEFDIYYKRLISIAQEFTESLVPNAWKLSLEIYNIRQYIREVQKTIQEYNKLQEDVQSKEESIVDSRIFPLALPKEVNVTVDHKLQEQEREAAEAFKKECKEKVVNFKAAVTKRREEKEHLKEAQKKREAEAKDLQSAFQKEEDAKKDARLMENGFRLLFDVNKHNLQLLTEMFAKPTPHHTIRYQAIESLFGQEPGKLKGSLTSVRGSHRKITIDNVVGFFDKILGSTAEKVDKPKTRKSDQEEIRGPMFQVHQKNHSGRLPSVAVEMITSTLARVGITKETLKLFIDMKERMLQEKREVPSWQVLLAFAQTPVITNDSKITVK